MNFKQTFFAALFLCAPFGLLAQQHTAVKAPLKNVLRVSPATIFYGGVGAGVSYERFLDEERKVSLMLPLSFGIRNYMIGSYNSTYVPSDDNNFSLMFNPGIRMYPKGQRRLSYAIGASFFTTYGTENGYKLDAVNAGLGYNEYTKSTEMRLGSLLSNSLTINVSRRLNIGLEALLGCSFRTFLKDKTNNVTRTEPVKAMGGFSVQVGYRF